jgi:hypothetical protein
MREICFEELKIQAFSILKGHIIKEKTLSAAFLAH